MPDTTTPAAPAQLPQWQPGAVVRFDLMGAWGISSGYDTRDQLVWLPFGGCNLHHCTPLLPAPSTLDSWQAAWDALQAQFGKAIEYGTQTSSAYIEKHNWEGSDFKLMLSRGRWGKGITCRIVGHVCYPGNREEANDSTPPKYRTLQAWLAAGAPTWNAAAQRLATGAQL